MAVPTLDELMTRWQQAREQGKPLTPEELCRDCPDLISQVKARIAAIEVAVRDLPAVVTEPTGPSVVPGRHPNPPTSLPPAANEPPPDLSFLEPAKGSGELGRLGPYRVLAVLGQGGLGLTLRGQDATSQREVVLKAMYPDLAKDKEIRHLFRQEARNASTLDHPRLVHVLHTDTANGIPYLAMPVLQGEPLTRRLSSRPLPMTEVVRLGKAIAEALEAIHVRGLAHRDLKPGNVWLEKDSGQVLLLDYGLARSLEGSPEHSRDSRLIGVAAYLAPEQLREPMRADRRADFFALGCLLFEMATGRRAFPGETVMDVTLAIRSENPDPFQVNPAIPKELGWLIRNLLRKDPAQRPETARQVLNKLDDIERVLAQPKRAEPLPAPSRTWLWVLLAVLILGGVAGAVWYLVWKP